MNRVGTWVLSIVVLAAVRAAPQETVVSIDNEPHYSRVFSNSYCRAYVVSLGRLQETKPVAYEHDSVEMTLGGTVERAWGGSAFSQRGYEDPEGYYLFFHFPVSRVTLRNPRSDPYRAMIVEIMQPDDSRNRWRDPSLDPFYQRLGIGADPNASYVTSLGKTSVEIVNVQLVGGDAKEIRSHGVGDLFVAMTDVHLLLTPKGGEAQEIQLDKGEVKWLPGGATAQFKNVSREPARFVTLQMK